MDKAAVVEIIGKFHQGLLSRGIGQTKSYCLVPMPRIATGKTAISTLPSSRMTLKDELLGTY